MINNKINTIKFQDFTIANEEFLLKNKIDNNMWESILAYIAILKNFRFTNSGLIDPKYYIKDNFQPDAWHKGLYYFLMADPRGNVIFGTQTKKENLPFCGLVPLILAAHKKYNNIPFNKWSLDGLSGVVNSSLCEVMHLKGKAPTFDKEYLLELREEGLVVKSGKNAGSIRKAHTAYGLTGISRVKNPEFTALPKLAQIILTQTWAASPMCRNKYMILDLNDWDNMPEPLDSSEIFNDNSGVVWQEKKKDSPVELPWD